MVVEMVEKVPLHTDEHGVIRVANTRVALETVVLAFEGGSSPEEMAQDLPVALADLYAAISYCLRHPDEVGAYMKERRAWADEMRRKVQSRFGQGGLRERLTARLA
jgi:uncharacterized protein (DUF433 family)